MQVEVKVHVRVKVEVEVQVQVQVQVQVKVNVEVEVQVKVEVQVEVDVEVEVEVEVAGKFGRKLHSRCIVYCHLSIANLPAGSRDLAVQMCPHLATFAAQFPILSNSSCVWSTNVLLSTVHSMIYYISIIMSHNHPFVVVKSPPEYPNKALGCKMSHCEERNGQYRPPQH